MEKSIKVTFQPEGRSVYVLHGTSIFEAAGEAGIIIDSPCGGKGTCGKCRIIIHGEKLPANIIEKKLIEASEIEKGVRLACQTKILSELTIEIPYTSRFAESKILVSGVLPETKEINHCLTKKYIEFPQSSSDAGELVKFIQTSFQDFNIDGTAYKKISDFVKENGPKLTLVFCGRDLIDIEKSDTTKKNYGLAVDLGTTTIVCVLIDMNDGHEIDVIARMNPQVVYGDDVITRINYIINEKEGLRTLNGKVISLINEMIIELEEKKGISARNIYKMTVAGNSTMQHIFLNIDPRSLGFIPFEPVIKEGKELVAKDTSIKINQNGRVIVFPNIAGFVGGDTVAAVLSSRIFKGKDIRLLIDIGTNGEIVLGNEEKILCASTAAGPAFEGARISQGMRASSGAIEKVVFTFEDVEVNVIDNLEPVGICGSGLIDAVAEMLKAGIIDETGKIIARDKLPKSVPVKIAERVVKQNQNNGFMLAINSKTGKPVFVTQKDVRELQLAKAAISAGINILKKEMGIEDKDITEIFLAGGFGNFIRRANAKRIKLIPNLPSEKIKFIGNASLSGAKLTLLSDTELKRSEQLAKFSKYIELSQSPDFQLQFAEAMFF